METKTAIEKSSDIELVNMINEAEKLVWVLNHNAVKENIAQEGTDNPVIQLIKTRNAALEALMTRTNISDIPSIKFYVRTKLKEQDNMWNAQWTELYKEGAVFFNKHLTTDKLAAFETIRTYLPTYGTSGPKEYILARVRGTLRFRRFDNRDITKLERISESDQPQYANCPPITKGLIKVNEEHEKRNLNHSITTPSWIEFNSWDHTIFYHKGFDEIFETIDIYNLPNAERCPKNEVILARSHARPVFVEFAPTDLGLIDVVTLIPRYRNGRSYNLDG